MAGFQDQVILSTLAKLVAEKGGYHAFKSADCKDLAKLIKVETGFSLSETTLKRFFGFVSSGGQLSYYSLNALALYAGYKDWDDYLSGQPKQVVQANTFWISVQEEALKLSRYTLQIVRNRSGIPIILTLPNVRANEEIQEFLAGTFQATSLIAPPGYGKSIFLSQLAGRCWLDPEPLFPKDIVWYLSGKDLGGLSNLGFDLFRWFRSLLGLSVELSPLAYLNRNPSQVVGRWILILDGFDDINIKTDQLSSFYAFVLNVSSINPYPWFKIIISCRPTFWAPLRQRIVNSAQHSAIWFLPKDRQEYYHPMPSLAKEDIKQFIEELFAVQLGSDEKVFDDLICQLKNPFCIELLYGLHQSSQPALKLDQFLYFHLITESILVRIYQSRHSSAKISIIKRFIELLKTGAGQVVEKATLGISTSHHQAYQELINYGILEEVNKSNRFGYRRVVFMLDHSLLPYFLASDRLLAHGHRLDAEGMNELDQEPGLAPIKIATLKWMIYSDLSLTDHQKLDWLRKLARG